MLLSRAESMTSKWQNDARQFGVQYNGLQQTLRSGVLPMFTHPQYGTFVVADHETLADAIMRKAHQFNNPPIETTENE